MDATDDTGDDSGGSVASAPLREDYRVVEELGRGAQGRSLLVESRESGRRLVAKHLWLGPVDDWKAVELFERSAEVLEELDLPGIPAYVDHRATEAAGREGPDMYLLREYADGESLRAKLDEGWRPLEEQILDVAADVGEILAHLHGREPPVVHRDVKPANIVRGPDGETHRLVDFGTVQASILGTVGGSTMAGTAGYVPFEQLSGRAEPASDLYALGVTLIRLASGREPTELPTDGRRLAFRKYVDLSEPTQQLLADLTAPDVDERLGDAETLLERVEAIRPVGSDVSEVDTVPTRADVEELRKPVQMQIARGFRAVGWFMVMMGLVFAGGSWFVDEGTRPSDGLGPWLLGLFGCGLASALVSQSVLSSSGSSSPDDRPPR